MQRKGIHILHVDDNKDDLTIFKYNLTSLDKSVSIRWAASGEEALRILKNEKFDCIISDYEMSPGMKGMDLLKKVKRDLPNLPFIFLTGQGNEEIAAEAFRQGANDYFTKEYSLIYFRRILNSINQNILNFHKNLEGEIIQKSLVESEERYKRLVEVNPKAIVVHRDNKIIFINEAALEIIGIKSKPDYMIGRSVIDLVEPEYRKEAEQKIKNVSKGKLELKPSIYPAYLPGEKKVYVEVKSILITFEGEPAVLSVLDNITERIQTEETIQNLNSLLLAIRNINQIINHAEDFRKIIIKASEMLEKVRCFVEVNFALLDEDSGIIEPFCNSKEKSGAGKWSIDKAGKGNAPKCVKKALREGEIIVINNQLALCDKCVFCRSYCKNPHMLVPFKVKGQAAGLFCITSKKEHSINNEEIELMKDLVADLEYAHEKLEMEQAIKISEEKYRTFFNHSPDIMAISTIKDGIFKDVNDEFYRKSGYKKSEVIGKSSSELGIWGNEGYRKQCIDDIKKYGYFKNKNVVLKDRKGKEYSALLSASLIDYQGSTHLLTTSHDISDLKDAFKNLIYKEERFRSIFDNASDAIFISKENGKIVEVNGSAVQMLGYSEEELLSMKFQNIKTINHSRNLDRILKDTHRQGKTRLDTMLITKNGDQKEVEISGSIFSFQNEILFQFFIRDISAERKAEKFSRRLNTYLRALADINYKLLISANPRDEVNTIIQMVGKAADVSRCYLILNDYSGGESFAKIQAEWVDKGIKKKMGDPRFERIEHNPAKFEYLDYLKRAETVYFAASNASGELHSIMKDFDIKSHVMIPIIYENDFKGILCLDDCKRERKWHEEELILLKAAAGSLGSCLRQWETKKELEEINLLMKEFINSTSDCFELKDSNGKYIMVNPAAASVYGTTPEEMVGKNDHDYLSYETSKIFDMEFRKIITSRKSKEFLFFNHDLPVPKVYHTLLFPVLNPVTGDALVGSIKRDITERQKDEEKIRKINEELDEFVHTVSHDLKAPLQSMIGYLEMIQKLEDDKKEEIRAKALAQGKMMQGFISQLLKLSRLGRSIGSFICFDSTLVVKDVFEVFKVNYPYAILQIKGNLPIVNGDVNRIREVFQNIIANALENSDPAKTRPIITVSCIQESKRYVYSIQDNGKGMDENTQKRLFILGYTTSDDKTHRYGIGLNIAKRIVEAHDGEIWVESKPGLGSTFYFSLPRWN